MDRRTFLNRSFFLSAGLLVPRVVWANTEPVVETAQGRVRGRVAESVTAISAAYWATGSNNPAMWAIWTWCAPWNG